MQRPKFSRGFRLEAVKLVWERGVLRLAKDREDRAQTYRTRNHAKAGLFDYIKRFYDPTRRRLTLGYLRAPRTPNGSRR